MHVQCADPRSVDVPSKSLDQLVYARCPAARDMDGPRESPHEAAVRLQESIKTRPFGSCPARRSLEGDVSNHRRTARVRLDCSRIPSLAAIS